MYNITITKTEQIPCKRREWRKVTDNEVAEEQYKYVDDDWTKNESITIYSQNLEDVDVSAIIVAINKSD